jgi:hypothetical protein
MPVLFFLGADMVKIQIRLTDFDFNNLRILAAQEYRDPRQQAGILIKEALENRGFPGTEKSGNENPCDALEVRDVGES